jgi:hypothetical protein
MVFASDAGQRQIRSSRPIGDELAHQIEQHCAKPAQG